MLVRSIGARHRLSEADLDEVMQDVRIRLWKSGPSSEQIRALGASYVYRVATSAAVDLIRRRRARATDRTESVDSLADQIPDARVSATRDLETDELHRRVLAAIETIPDSRRAVVRMYLAGYDREEIADMMAWSEAKTRNLLYRGLADLRARLGETGIAGER